MKKQFLPDRCRAHSEKWVIGIFLCSLLAFTTSAHSQVVNSKQNSRQLALLHWYGANQTTQFSVGTAFPYGVVFCDRNFSWWCSLRRCKYLDHELE
jgi:hypothetical protein